MVLSEHRSWHTSARTMQSSGKTIALWLGLMIVFAAMYAMFTGEASGQPSGSASPGAWGWFVGLLLVIGGFVAYARFQANRPWRKQYDAAMEAFAKGRFAEALDLWTQCLEKTPWKPTVRVNLGSARLNLWQLKLARQDLLEAVTLATGARQTNLPPIAWVQLAFLDALEGHAAASRESTAKAGAPKGVILNLPQLTQAVLDVREGKLDQAQRSLRSSEMHQITGTLGELVRVLDAFCVFLASGQLRHVDKVALFQEAAPDELRRAWPELAAFLDRAPQS